MNKFANNLIGFSLILFAATWILSIINSHPQDVRHFQQHGLNK